MSQTDVCAIHPSPLIELDNFLRELMPNTGPLYKTTQFSLYDTLPDNEPGNTSTWNILFSRLNLQV